MYGTAAYSCVLVSQHSVASEHDMKTRQISKIWPNKILIFYRDEDTEAKDCIFNSNSIGYSIHVTVNKYGHVSSTTSKCNVAVNFTHMRANMQHKNTMHSNIKGCSTDKLKLRNTKSKNLPVQNFKCKQQT